MKIRNPRKCHALQYTTFLPGCFQRKKQDLRLSMALPVNHIIVRLVLKSIGCFLFSHIVLDISNMADTKTWPGQTDKAHPHIFNTVPPQVNEKKIGQLNDADLKQFFDKVNICVYETYAISMGI